MENILRVKSESYVKPLKHVKVSPCAFVKIVDGKMVDCGEYKPFILRAGESVIVRFPTHLVGYIGYSVASKGYLADSPTVLKFIPGEYLAEIVCSQEEYVGALSSGWLQREEKASVFLPADELLTRRFAFVYLKIERLDTAEFPVEISNLYCDSVSASSMDDLKLLDTKDERLQQIYRYSAKSLLDCSHDVIEDAPKRDRRLWMGEFRISALIDSATFGNIDLIKRCLYLFAAHKVDEKIVAPCVFQYSPPYVDSYWYFIDFALWFVAALADYDDLYPTAKEQIFVAKEWYDGNRDKRASFWIDWKPDLDQSMAREGLYVYILRMAKQLAEKKQDEEFIAVINEEIVKHEKKVLAYFDEDKNLFSSDSGQISVISQVYGILSGVFDKEKCSTILDSIIAYGEKATPLHTPNVYNYYLEAMYRAGRTDLMMDLIENVWGRMMDLGEYCCPEYIPWIDSPSRYKHPVMDSACHASGGSPAYWLQKLYSKK